MEAPHMLILDEPTNHLDIDSRRALLDALNDYEGAVILITHDRSLMELVADRLWLAADGSVKPFKGDMDDYAKLVLDRARVAARAPSQIMDEPKAAAPPAVEAPPPPPRPKPAAAPLKRKLEAAELDLARATEALSLVDDQLGDPTLYARNRSKFDELSAKRAKAQARLDKAEAEWMAAAEALSEATA